MVACRLDVASTRTESPTAVTPGLDGGAATLVGVGRGAGFLADGGRGFGLGFGAGFGRVVVADRVGVGVAVVVAPAAGDGGPGDDSRVAAPGDRSAAFELLQPPTTQATIAINTAIPHRVRTP